MEMLYDLLRASNLWHIVKPEIEKLVEEDIATYDLRWEPLERKGAFTLYCASPVANFNGHENSLLLKLLLENGQVDSVRQGKCGEFIRFSGEYKSYTTGSHTKSVYVVPRVKYSELGFDYKVEYGAKEFNLDISLLYGGHIVVVDLVSWKSFRDLCFKSWISEWVKVG